MRQILILTLTTFILSGCVADRNVPKPHSITEALQFEDYKARLEGVRFYYGNQRHPKVEKSIGVRTTARRSSMGDQTRKTSCARAFASALLVLKSAAVRNGGDAVINIKSNYKHREVSSESQFQCASGVLMSGVALKGTVVKLRK